MNDYLLSVSQLGVAFAGFTGVVAVLGRHAEGSWSRGDVLRFWQMLEISLLLVIVPLVPITGSEWMVQDNPKGAYALACLVLGICSALQMSRATARTIAARKADPTISVGFTLSYLAIGCVVLVLQVAGAFGWQINTPQRVLGSEQFFFIGVFWHICLASVLFWRLMKFSGIPLPSEKTDA